MQIAKPPCKKFHKAKDKSPGFFNEEKEKENTKGTESLFYCHALPIKCPVLLFL